MAERGFDGSYVCKSGRRGALAEEIEEAGGSVHTIRLTPGHVGYVRGVGRLIAEEGYDIVHNHLQTYAGLGAFIARRAGVPVISSFHNTVFAAQTWTRAPVVRSLRAMYSSTSIRYGLAHSDCITGCSESVLDTVCGDEAGLRAKSRVIYYGVEPASPVPAGARGLFRRSLGIPEPAPVCLHVGSFFEQKNHAGVIHVFERVVRDVPDAHLVLVGDGPLRKSIEMMIRDRGLEDRVLLLGLRDDVSAMMSHSDIFIFPSLHEGFPLVALEASAAGLPVVGSRIPGLAEAVEDGVTGLLFDTHDVEAMAAAAGGLLKDPSRRASMGAAGRARVAERFSVDASVNQLAAAYDDCTGHR
jgi:glycosyltransferase EpsF